MFKHTYTEEIVIEASAQVVWDVLTDFGSYSEWHPFTPNVRVKPEVGAKIRQDVNMFPGRKPFKFKGSVSLWDVGHAIGWKMNYWPFMWAERIQQIDTIDEGRCRYYTADMNAGILNPIVKRIYGAAIYRGFRETAEALKSRAELSS